jgi:26S proteasome regulatory subunit N9
VEILAIVVVQYKDHKEAIAFLQQTEPKVQGNVEAVALCKVLAGGIMLNSLQDQLGTKVCNSVQSQKSIIHSTNFLIRK